MPYLLKEYMDLIVDGLHDHLKTLGFEMLYIDNVVDKYRNHISVERLRYYYTYKGISKEKDLGFIPIEFDQLDQKGKRHTAIRILYNLYLTHRTTPQVYVQVEGGKYKGSIGLIVKDKIDLGRDELTDKFVRIGLLSANNMSLVTDSYPKTRIVYEEDEIKPAFDSFKNQIDVNDVIVFIEGGYLTFGVVHSFSGRTGEIVVKDTYGRNKTLKPGRNCLNISKLDSKQIKNDILMKCLSQPGKVLGN